MSKEEEEGYSLKNLRCRLAFGWEICGKRLAAFCAQHHVVTDDTAYTIKRGKFMFVDLDAESLSEGSVNDPSVDLDEEEFEELVDQVPDKVVDEGGARLWPQILRTLPAGMDIRVGFDGDLEDSHLPHALVFVEPTESGLVSDVAKITPEEMEKAKALYMKLRRRDLPLELEPRFFSIISYL
jgi:hypothetical protein